MSSIFRLENIQLVFGSGRMLFFMLALQFAYGGFAAFEVFRPVRVMLTPCKANWIISFMQLLVCWDGLSCALPIWRVQAPLCTLAPGFPIS